MSSSRLLLQSGKSIELYRENGNVYSVQNHTLRDVLDLESKETGLFFSYLYLIITGVLDYADVLWVEQEVWYEDLDNWEFFLQRVISPLSVDIIVSQTINNNKLEIVEKATLVKKEYSDALNFFLDTKGDYVLWGTGEDSEDGEEYNHIYLLNVGEVIKNPTPHYNYDGSGFKLTAHNYMRLVQILKEMNWVNPFYEFTKGGTKYAKKVILKHDYRKRQRNKGNQTTDLSSIVSSLIVKGQKYNDVLDYPIYLIYEIYHRFLKLDEWNNTMMTLSNGNLDTKKHPIDWEKINWTSIIKQENN